MSTVPKPPYTARLVGKSLTYLSCDTVLNSFLFSGLLCIRREAVRTNCPTVAPKPERNALKGYITTQSVLEA